MQQESAKMTDSGNLSSSSGPTVSTTQTDFAPGTIAAIDVAGFDPGATVEFEVQSETVAADGSITLGNPFTWFATVAADGTLSTNFYANAIYAGQTLSLTATEVQIGANGAVTPISTALVASTTMTVGAATSPSPAPALTTDKSDYAPGSTAYISATGFGADDAITFSVDTIDSTTGAVLTTGQTWTANANST